MDPTTVLVSNLTSAFAQVNQYLALGLAAAVASLLADLPKARTNRTALPQRMDGVSDPEGAGQKEVSIAGFPIPLSLDMAKLVLIAVAFGAGVMAYVAAVAVSENATLLVAAQRVNGTPQSGAVSMLDAVCAYPSVVTAEPLVRFGAILLPAVFASATVWRIYRRLEALLSGERGAAITMTLLALAPYAAMALTMRRVPC
jgi:hypothetical protein